jgi:hypothetical protein
LEELFLFFIFWWVLDIPNNLDGSWNSAKLGGVLVAVRREQNHLLCFDCSKAGLTCLRTTPHPFGGQGAHTQNCPWNGWTWFKHVYTIYIIIYIYI